MSNIHREKLQLQAVSLVEEGDESFEREIAGLKAATKERADKSPLAQPTRSLAFIKFVLCHSLPTVNENGACWTYATLRNSVNSVVHQLVDINHKLRDNMSVMSDMPDDQHDLIIGHMVSGEIAASPDDLLVPSKAVPIVVTAVLYKRAAGVQSIINSLKAGKPVKVSMECEFDDVGFFCDGKLLSRTENPEFASAHKAGKKLVAGKPYARVIGGVTADGGMVNFHGAAILVGDQPADPNADVLEAVATRNAIMELGGTESASAITSVDDGEEVAIPVKDSNGNTVGDDGLFPPITPPTFDGPVEDVTLENIQKGQERQLQAISDIEKSLTTILDRWEKMETKLSMASADSNPDEADRLKDVKTPGVKHSPLNEDDRHDDIMIETDNDAPTNLGDKDVQIDPNTEYADPGYGKEGVPSWPLTTPEGVLAAADFFSHIENTMCYTPAQISVIQEKILHAAVKFKLNIPSALAAAVMAASGAKDIEAANAERHTDQAQEVNNMTEEEKAAEAAAATKRAEEDKAAAEAAKAEEEAKLPPEFLKKKKGDDNKDDDDDEDDDEDDKKPDFLKKKKAKASDEEEASSLRNRLEELTRQNETLAAEVKKMQDGETKRQKAERAGKRKTSLADKIGLDDELAADLNDMLHESEDEEFESFSTLAEKIYTRGLKKALEAQMASAGSTEAADKDKEPAKAPESETATRKPFAPTKAENGEGGGTPTTNPFRGL